MSVSKAMPFKSYPGGVGVVAASYMRRTCCAIVDHDDDHYLGRLSVRTRLGADAQIRLEQGHCQHTAFSGDQWAFFARCFSYRRPAIGANTSPRISDNNLANWMVLRSS